jgi:cytoskeleton protein RodZ
MSESDSSRSAGSMLRAAREKQNLHIAALAAAIKVSPRKLDALEHDRYDELPDATFTRALAQSVCRTLRIDPQPVLALLPPTDASSLEQVTGTLNEPFRDRAGRGGRALAVAAIRPLVWASGALMLAAVVVYFLPTGAWRPRLDGASPNTTAVPALAPAASAAPPVLAAASAPAVAVPEPAASAPAPVASEPIQAPAPAPATVAQASAPAPEPVRPAVPGAAASALPGNALVLRSSAPSWVEVRDARAQILLSRIVQPGETVGLDGAAPIRVTVGNAGSTQVFYRGRPVDLQPSMRENVARLELQ